MPRARTSGPDRRKRALSPADHDAIHALAAEGLKAKAIGRRIEKHPSTVQWFMYSAGLAAPRYDARPFTRNGRLCTPFCREEDACLEALRIEGLGPTAIAQAVNARFGRNRSMHTVSCRLVMIAARDDAPAQASAS